MATQAALQERSTALAQLVRGWDRRLRAQQAAVWLPRAVLPGLALGITAAVVSRLRPWLLPGQVLLLAAAGVALGIVVMLLAVWLWPRPMLTAARRFDRLFGLQERVSTALELLEGRLQSSGELAARQIDDAWMRAQTVRAGDALPLVFRWREWTAVLALLAVLVLLVVLPNPQTAAIAQNAAQEAALADAAEDLKDITEEIASEAALTPEQREQILQALEDSITTLQEPDVSPEEAFASLSDTEAALQSQADQMQQQSAEQQAAMEAAAEALRQALEQAAQAQQGQESAIPTLEQLRQQMQQMTEQQRQQAAQALEQAAQALQQADPNTAQALEQAAQALRQGDTGAAQQALDQAMQDMQASQQAQQSQQQAAQNLEQAAQDVQQAADQVSQQTQQGQPTQQQQGQQGQLGQPQQGQQAQSQPGQPGDQGQQGQEGQPGQPGQEGQPGQAGQQPGDQGQPGQVGQQPADGAGEQGQQGQPANSPSDRPAAGAGDAPVGAGSDDLGGQPQQQAGQIDTGNNPDGTGEGQFDPVYAPRRIGGQGDDQVVLEPDAGNVPSVEGEFAENPTGDASVPYNQVFSDYADAANRALESDYIPLGLRDVVRDYFSSLEPRQGQR
ncbi:MAG: hypothetical protein HZC41_03375 [Chloroflexi bacterium]|nr:hypothetical protein [Chloroflexota bacterium]